MCSSDLTGLPMMRAMVLEFPEDPTCRTLDRQYMLGGDLLVAPVFHETRSEYYLPAGSWVHLLTGEVREGGRWFFDALDYFGMPLWIRSNAVVPVGHDAARVDYDYAGGVRLVCGKLDGSSARSLALVDARGKPSTRFELTQNERRVVVSNLDMRRDFRVHLPWANGIGELDGCELAPARAGREVLPGVEIVAAAPRVAFTWR